VISLRIFAAFDGRKYFARNLTIISFHISIDSLCKELNHYLALSLSEKGKISKRTTSAGTLFMLLGIAYLKEACYVLIWIIIGKTSKLALILCQLNYIRLQLKVVCIDGWSLYSRC